jgi:excisionase family DNA binding protein
MLTNTADFLTCAEVAELRHCTSDAVRKWIYRGWLPARRVGRQWLILRKDAISMPQPLRGKRTSSR